MNEPPFREYDLQPAGRFMLGLALRGFHGAMLRFEESAARSDIDHGFLAATEALWWACSLDEQMRQRPDSNGEPWYEQQREKDWNGQVLRALSYARNRTTHALPMTVDYSDTYSDTFTAGYGTIVWQPLDALPDPPAERPDKAGRARYAAELAGREVAPTLARAAGWFAAVQNDVRAGLSEPLPSTRPPWDDGRDSAQQ